MRPLLLILLLSLGATAAAAELNARLDRDRISDAETVMLYLTLSGDARGNPDLAPLVADFDLVDQSHTSRMSLINGVASSSREWRLELAPRRTGVLTVPSLKVGNLASEPLTLEVLDAGAAAGPRSDEPVFIEVTATPEAPYVQGRVEYRVRLFARVPLQQPRLTDPVADGVIAQRQGEDSQSFELVDGQRYTVIERHYALFPQRSGLLEIAPPQLSAALPVERPKRAADGFGGDPFGPIDDVFGALPGVGGLFEATRQVRVRGQAVKLDVRPQPVAAPTPWLPAESVQLSDEWAPATPTVQVGEAITRTLTITATGVSSAQLPDLELTAPPGVKLYPDPPSAEDLQRGAAPVAVKRIKVALVATAPGRLTLPEIRLSWWDTAADQPREALVPARTLEVVATGGVAGGAVRGGTADSDPAWDASGVGGQNRPAGLPAGSWAGMPAFGFWPWLTAALALGWLATLGLWWRERRRIRPTPAPAVGPTPTTKSRPLGLADARLAVERACRNRGARDVRDALFAWGALAWPDDPPRGLAGLAVRLDSDQAAAVLTALERGLYAGGPMTWDGAAAWAALAPALTGHDESEGEKREPVLPELYPRVN